MHSQTQLEGLEAWQIPKWPAQEKRGTWNSLSLFETFQVAHKKNKLSHMSALESAQFTTGLTEIRLRQNTVSYLLFYVLIPVLVCLPVRGGYFFLFFQL